MRTRPRLGGRGWLIVCALAPILVLNACALPAEAPPIRVGLIAPLTGPLAASGVAIQRGILLAIDEINGSGGVHGRRIELVVRDVHNDVAAGNQALIDLAENEGIVAVFGGIFSPVMVGQLDTLHRLEIPLIDPWGSMTAITENGRDPNYAFRVSVSDRQADEFLVRYAAEVVGSQRPAIMADTSGWGEANLHGVIGWLAQRGREPVGVERFDQGDTNMNPQIRRLRQAGADALLLIANAPEGAVIVRGMSSQNWRVPVISHWGISGGRFAERAGSRDSNGVFTLQTFSFFGDLNARGQAVLDAYHEHFGTTSADEILAPVGVAHGYDGMRLLGLAMQRAESVTGPAIRSALEHLPAYDGLVKRYDPAFTPERHDALLAEDYIMAVWQDGRLAPAPQPRIQPRP